MGRDAVFGHYLRDGEVKRFWRKAAAVRFFKKAIGDNEVPEKITFDRSS